MMRVAARYSANDPKRTFDLKLNMRSCCIEVLTDVPTVKIFFGVLLGTALCAIGDKGWTEQTTEFEGLHIPVRHTQGMWTPPWLVGFEGDNDDMSIRLAVPIDELDLDTPELSRLGYNGRLYFILSRQSEADSAQHSKEYWQNMCLRTEKWKEAYSYFDSTHKKWLVYVSPRINFIWYVVTEDPFASESCDGNGHLVAICGDREGTPDTCSLNLSVNENYSAEFTGLEYQMLTRLSEIRQGLGRQLTQWSRAP